MRTQEERAAFKRSESERIADLHPGVKELLIAERRATVERIRERLEKAMEPYGEIDDMFKPEILAILDEEADR